MLKLELWFVLWSFFFLSLLCISINLPNGLGAGALSCHLGMLEKLQKRIYRTVGSSLAASLESLAHRWNVPSLSFSIDITLVDVHQNWLNWFHFFFLEVGLFLILKYCMIFLSPFLDVKRMSMSTISFLVQLGSEILYV